CDRLSDAHDAINQIHAVQRQVDAAAQKASGNPGVTGGASKLNDKLNSVLHKLYEPRFTGFDDQTLIYPLQLNNRLAAMQNYLGGDAGPTEQVQQVLAQLSSELDQEFAQIKHALDVDLAAFNSLLKTASLPAITVSSVARTASPE